MFVKNCYGMKQTKTMLISILIFLQSREYIFYIYKSNNNFKKRKKEEKTT